MWFKTVKGFYDQGLYTKDDVKIFVLAKMITKEEYKKITGEDYVE